MRVTATINVIRPAPDIGPEDTKAIEVTATGRFCRGGDQFFSSKYLWLDTYDYEPDIELNREETSRLEQKLYEEANS